MDRARARARVAILQIYLFAIIATRDYPLHNSVEDSRNWCARWWTMSCPILSYGHAIRMRVRTGSRSRRRRTESLGAKCPSKERRRSSTSTRGEQFFCATLCVSAQLPALRRHGYVERKSRGSRERHADNPPLRLLSLPLACAYNLEGRGRFRRTSASLRRMKRRG